MHVYICSHLEGVATQPLMICKVSILKSEELEPARPDTKWYYQSTSKQDNGVNPAVDVTYACPEWPRWCWRNGTLFVAIPDARICQLWYVLIAKMIAIYCNIIPSLLHHIVVFLLHQQIQPLDLGLHLAKGSLFFVCLCVFASPNHWYISIYIYMEYMQLHVGY